jgi:fructoselysine 6-kinase
VASVGDNCVDVALETDHGPHGTGSEFPGGNAFNVAVELSRLGCTSRYFGAVGTDPQADLIVEAALAAGVDVSGLQRVPGRTGRSVVSRDETGERQFVSEDYGVAATYRLDADTAAQLAQTRWVHFARQPDLAQWAPQLRAGGARLSCDLGLEGGPEMLAAFAPWLDVVFLSSSSAGERSAEELLMEALAAGARLAVVTMGAAGSIAATTERRWKVDAVPVARVTDSLGAGDAYIAAFITAQLDGREIEASLSAGAVAGAAACTRWGLAAQLTTDEVPA